MTKQEPTTWPEGKPPIPQEPPAAPSPDTPQTKRLKEGYGPIAALILAYSLFYTFCMYRNGSSITFPLFLGSSLLLLRFLCGRLNMALKKGSGFYMAAVMLFGISTFCTDDARLIFFNNLGIFLLMMSLLLKQYCDTAKWQLGKHLGAICALAALSLGELGRPVSDGIAYGRQRERKTDRRVWYALLGLLIAVPLLFAVLALLASADAVFRQMTDALLESIRFGTIFGILLRIAFMFFATYALVACLCGKRIREEVADRRTAEPILAITVTGLLTALYLLFSGIQVMGLFLGKLRLPAGYTYAMYAREGFFQLLAVGFLNLAMVLGCMRFFRDSPVLKAILTVMSFCTFIMIASSAMRMVMYIRYYYLTFLRILVLWALALLAVLFVGVTIRIFRETFPLFRYSIAAVTVLYLALSFAHPDYIIARVNVANAGQEKSGQQGGFFLAEKPYEDYAYLSRLSADAAPVLVPYLEELGYYMEAFYYDSPGYYAFGNGADYDMAYSQEGFGYCWMSRIRQRTQQLGIRSFNVSRAVALQGFRRAAATSPDGGSTDSPPGQPPAGLWTGR